MHLRPSRRAFLCTVAAAARAAEQLPIAPAEAAKFRDPATEFELIRLTDPAKSNSWLPKPPLRSFSRGADSILYCSDRSGSPQAWRVDVRGGENRCLTAAQALVPTTLSYGANDRTLLYFDGPSLVVHTNRPRTVHTLENGWTPAGAIAVSTDGSDVAFTGRKDSRYQLRVLHIGQSSSNMLTESSEPVRFIRFRPRRSTLLYGHANGVALVSGDGRGERKLKLSNGEIHDAAWSADGSTIHYVVTPEPGRAIQLRDFTPESGEDKLVANTTQFVSLAANANSSVFAGVSGSKAAPYILLLIRTGRRELTVAEHRASDPALVSIAFSPDGQRLYYNTDREGRMAIYSIALERFVEKTDISACKPSPALLYPG
jgi:oligogalacturonide lyase